MTDKISVLLVDDHSLVRRGFRRILEDEPDIEVVGRSRRWRGSRETGAATSARTLS